MKKYDNRKKLEFFSDFPLPNLDSEDDLLTTRCKFNFHYMDFNQKAGQKFSDWKQTKLAGLLDKLRIYGEQPLSYWEQQRAGSKDGKVLTIYGKFPAKSKTKFKNPKKTVPHQARWGRFRLGAGARLVGFVIPDDYHGKIHPNTKMRFDYNTFYAVFLDMKHEFWK